MHLKSVRKIFFTPKRFLGFDTPPGTAVVEIIFVHGA